MNVAGSKASRLVPTTFRQLVGIRILSMALAGTRRKSCYRGSTWSSPETSATRRSLTLVPVGPVTRSAPPISSAAYASLFASASSGRSHRFGWRPPSRRPPARPRRPWGRRCRRCPPRGPPNPDAVELNGQGEGELLVRAAHTVPANRYCGLAAGDYGAGWGRGDCRSPGPPESPPHTPRLCREASPVMVVESNMGSYLSSRAFATAASAACRPLPQIRFNTLSKTGSPGLGGLRGVLQVPGDAPGGFYAVAFEHSSASSRVVGSGAVRPLAIAEGSSPTTSERRRARGRGGGELS